MIVAYSYISATGRAAADFAGAMSRRAREVERFPGFIRFEFRREIGHEKRYVIATWWESRAALRAYLSSEEHRVTHQKLSSETRAAIGAPRVEIHDVLEVSS